MKKLMLVVAVAVVLMSGCGDSDDGLVDTLQTTEESIDGVFSLIDTIGCAVGSDIACDN